MPSIVPALSVLLASARHNAEESLGDRLDAEEMARTLTGFRGQPRWRTSAMRYTRSAADGIESAYVFDADTAMVYIVE